MQVSQVDEWLKMWHSWSSSVRAVSGYPGVAAGCSLYRPSKQYDDTNGALDAAADRAEAEDVDSVIRKMPPLNQSALSMEARNLCSVRVWSSARIPSEDAKRVVAESRQMLWDGMSYAELVDEKKLMYI